jgi:hypothetical protein
MLPIIEKNALHIDRYGSAPLAGLSNGYQQRSGECDRMRDYHFVGLPIVPGLPSARKPRPRVGRVGVENGGSISSILS